MNYRKINKKAKNIVGSEYRAAISTDQKKIMRMYATYQKNYHIMKAKVEALTSDDTYMPKMYSFKEYRHQINKQKEIYKEKNKVRKENRR